MNIIIYKHLPKDFSEIYDEEQCCVSIFVFVIRRRRSPIRPLLLYKGYEVYGDKRKPVDSF